MGILAFLDSTFNLYGDFFRQINSMFFMLISLGILVRSATKKNEQKKEKYEHRILELEYKIKNLEVENKKVTENY